MKQVELAASLGTFRLLLLMRVVVTLQNSHDLNELVQSQLPLPVARQVLVVIVVELGNDSLRLVVVRSVGIREHLSRYHYRVAIVLLAFPHRRSTMIVPTLVACPIESGALGRTARGAAVTG
jgi:hypothetical protein